MYASIPIVGLLVIVGVIVGGYFTIKKGWYSQALMLVSGVAGVICVIVGIDKLTDRITENDVVGAVLMGVGILTFLVIGVIVKVLFRNKPTANKATEATS